MNRTSIEWIFNPDGSRPGWSWNPVTGCLNDCSYCYARKLANGRLKPLYLANTNCLNAETAGVDLDPFYPRFWEERVREEFGSCYAGAIPKGIFVSDMGDLFGIGVPEAWTRRILSHIGMSWYREHRFYLLTKQPQNLTKFSPFPENCWVGSTCTSKGAVNHTLPYLMKVGAGKIYLSIEPLLKWDDGTAEITADRLLDAGINWLIIGACTGNREQMASLCFKYPHLTRMRYEKQYTAQPKIEWVREIVEAADKAGVKVFLKDNLKPIIKYPHTNPFLFAPNKWDLRQELPIEQ